MLKSWGSARVLEISSGVNGVWQYAKTDPVPAGYYWAIIGVSVATTDSNGQSLAVGIIEREIQKRNVHPLVHKDLHDAGYIRCYPGDGVTNADEMEAMTSQQYRQCSPVKGETIIVPSGWRFIAFNHNIMTAAVVARIMYLEIPNDSPIPFL